MNQASLSSLSKILIVGIEKRHTWLQLPGAAHRSTAFFTPVMEKIW